MHPTGVILAPVLRCETDGCEEALGSPGGCLCRPSVPEQFKDLKPSESLSHLSETLPPESLLLLSDFPEKPFHLSSALPQLAASPSPAKQEKAQSSEAVSFPIAQASLHESP